MKLPRDLNGDEVVKGLRRVGYEATRQKGDHVYMTTRRNGEHHVTVPLHKPLKVGTLAAILDSVAAHLGIAREVLLREMKI
jgi:predicted RNA binding protein YcfA (HicA-like mRNA interferase family)